MPLPTPLQPSSSSTSPSSSFHHPISAAPTIESPPTIAKRPHVSRFDVEPVSLSMNKRLKTEPTTTSTNPLSDSESESMIADPTSPAQPPSSSSSKKKKKSAFAKYGEAIGQTKDELQRRDRRMARFQEVEAAARATPPRVDTPDYVRDAQIAASIVSPTTPPQPLESG